MDDVAASSRVREGHAHGVTLKEAFRVWSQVAMLSFGRPARSP